jgi:hypothetical protein
MTAGRSFPQGSGHLPMFAAAPCEAAVAGGSAAGYAMGMSVKVGGRTKLTYEEYRHFPDDGRRHEIIDGEHYVSPSPGSRHQNASRHIQFSLYEQLERNGTAQVYNAPMDL